MLVLSINTCRARRRCRIWIRNRKACKTKFTRVCWCLGCLLVLSCFTGRAASSSTSNSVLAGFTRLTQSGRGSVLILVLPSNAIRANGSCWIRSSGSCPLQTEFATVHCRLCCLLVLTRLTIFTNNGAAHSVLTSSACLAAVCCCLCSLLVLARLTIFADNGGADGVSASSA